MLSFRSVLSTGFGGALIAVSLACETVEAPATDETKSDATNPETFARLHPDGPPGIGLSALNEHEIEHIYFQSSRDELVSAGVWEAKPYTSGPDTPEYSEFMYLISGSVTLEDANGRETTFGPGDAVLIPRGATHTWKQSEDLRKYWAIFDTGEPVSQTADGPPKSFIAFDPDVALGGDGRTREHMYFAEDNERISAGVWEADPQPREDGKEPEFHTATYTELMCILEGSVTIADPSGKVETFEAGDVVIVPRGTRTEWRQTEYVKKYWVIFDVEDEPT